MPVQMECLGNESAQKTNHSFFGLRITFDEARRRLDSLLNLVSWDAAHVGLGKFGCEAWQGSSLVLAAVCCLQKTSWPSSQGIDVARVVFPSA